MDWIGLDQKFSLINFYCSYDKCNNGHQRKSKMFCPLHSFSKDGSDLRLVFKMYYSFLLLNRVLTAKNRLELVASVNRGLNHKTMELTKKPKDVFESMEKNH